MSLAVVKWACECGASGDGEQSLSAHPCRLRSKGAGPNGWPLLHIMLEDGAGINYSIAFARVAKLEAALRRLLAVTDGRWEDDDRGRLRCKSCGIKTDAEQHAPTCAYREAEELLR